MWTTSPKINVIGMFKYKFWILQRGLVNISQSVYKIHNAYIYFICMGKTIEHPSTVKKIKSWPIFSFYQICFFYFHEFPIYTYPIFLFRWHSQHLSLYVCLISIQSSAKLIVCCLNASSVCRWAIFYSFSSTKFCLCGMGHL